MNKPLIVSLLAVGAAFAAQAASRGTTNIFFMGVLLKNG